MNFIDFKNSIQSDAKFSTYILEGEDVFFREKAKEIIMNAFVSEPELNYVSFDGEDCDVSQILASLNSFPFMSKKRVTFLREFYPDKKTVTRFEDFFSGSNYDSILVVSNENVCDAFNGKDNVCHVDCNKAELSVIVKWIKATCAKSNVSIDGETASTIAEYCLSSMTRINGETEKLIAYVGDGGVIDKNAVELLVNRDMEYKIFTMTGFIGQKKVDKALEIIKDMLSKGEPPTKITVSIYNYFRRLLFVSLSDMTNGELAKVFKIKETAVIKTKEQAKMFKKKSLKNAIDTIGDSDYKFKAGYYDEFSAMWLSVFKIMLG